MHLTRVLAALALSITACDSSVDSPEPSAEPTVSEEQSATVGDDTSQVAPAPGAPGLPASDAGQAPATPPTAPEAPPAAAPVPTPSTAGMSGVPSAAPTRSDGISIVTQPSGMADAGAPIDAIDVAADAALVAPTPPAPTRVEPDAGMLSEDELIELRRRTARIVIPSSSGEVQLEAALNADGVGSDRIGAIQMEDGVGTIEIDGASVRALAYAPVDWTEAGYMLYQTLAVARNRLFVVWFYCADERIQSIYSEGTHDAPLLWEPASGSCTQRVGGEPTSVSFPAIDMVQPTPIDGFHVEGPHLNVRSGRAGTFEMDGETLTVLPFQVVDCSTCPEDGFDGWYELHALLWDVSARKVRFGAFYLSPAHAGQIGLDYVIGLPDLTFGAAPRWFPADWTRLAANKSGALDDPRVQSLASPLRKPRAP